MVKVEYIETGLAISVKMLLLDIFFLFLAIGAINFCFPFKPRNFGHSDRDSKNTRPWYSTCIFPKLFTGK